VNFGTLITSLNTMTYTVLGWRYDGSRRLPIDGRTSAMRYFGTHVKFVHWAASTATFNSANCLMKYVRLPFS
jgi:hypothetical protein